MSLRYFDSATGRLRIKPRYVWASWAFAIGLMVGLAITNWLR
jgi:hypothetical protein